MALKPSFVAPSHVVLLEDFGPEFENDRTMISKLLEVRRDKSRLQYFPDVLLEDLWRIVDSFCWYMTTDVITASIPMSKLGTLNEELYDETFLYIRGPMDYFLGYEDGSEMQISSDSGTKAHVSGHYPIDLRTVNLCIHNVDSTKRALVQFSTVLRPWQWDAYCIIWTKQYSQIFGTGDEELLADTVVELKKTNPSVPVLLVIHGMLSPFG